MKKFFSIIGVLTILSFSFFYTEKLTNVVKEYDDIMIQIKDANNQYKVEPNNAIIDGNTIIPGIKGKEINQDKTYSKMKRYGKFDSDLIVYQDIDPTISIKNNFDKYVISGNPNKRMVSYIFLVENNDKIDKILKILEKNSLKGNFFIDGNWLENNNQLLVDLIKKGHNIGNLSYNRDYTNSSYPWTDTIIKKIGKQDFGYCYLEEENSIALKLCSLYNNYTIKPSIIVQNNPFKTVEENIKSGSIISFKITNSLEKELDSIIQYTKSKGFDIQTLNNHLEE